MGAHPDFSLFLPYSVITVKFIDFEPFSALLRTAGGAAGVLGGLPPRLLYLIWLSKMNCLKGLTVSLIIIALAYHADKWPNITLRNGRYCFLNMTLH